MWRQVFIWKSGQELNAGNLEAGPEAEVMKKCCLLACSHVDLLRLLSYSIHDHLSRGSTIYSRAGSSSINHLLRKRLIGLPTGQSDGGSLTIEVPPFQMTRACVKLA